MSVKEKYRPVIDLAERLGAKDVNIREENGKLMYTATVHSPKEKVDIWNQIKSIGGETPSDIAADIRMETDGRGSEPARGASSSGGQTYTVKSGDSLSKISQQFYGDANRYMEIFNANKDKLSNPDKIQPGHELIIPGKS